MKTKSLLLIAVISMLVCSCGTSKDINYLAKADELPQNVLNEAKRASDPIIVPGDLLNIIVTSETPKAVEPFNKLTFMQESGATTGSGNMGSGSGSGNSLMQYLVDNQGNIEFPVIGKLHVGGMNKSQIQDLVANQIYPKYVTSKPSVEVRLTNFHITVLGAVNSPGIKQSPNEQLTILEAVALSGDLNIHGVRTNIMVIRTNTEGVRSVHRVDLTDPNLLASPYFYLQQNDVIYVQPTGSLARSSWSVPPAFSFGVGILGTLFTITNFVLMLTRK